MFSVDWSSNLLHFFKKIFPIKPEEPLICVEIGSFEGLGSIRIINHLCNNIESRLYCIDHWDDFYVEDKSLFPEFQKKFKGQYNRFKKNTKHIDKIIEMKGFSDVMINKLPEKIDFCYLDGGNNQYQMYRDISNIFTKMNNGGIVLIDDYGWKYRNKIYTEEWDQFLEERKDDIEILYKDKGLAFRVNLKVKFDLYIKNCDPILLKNILPYYKQATNIYYDDNCDYSKSINIDYIILLDNDKYPIFHDDIIKTLERYKFKGINFCGFEVNDIYYNNNDLEKLNCNQYLHTSLFTGNSSMIKNYQNLCFEPINLSYPIKPNTKITPLSRNKLNSSFSNSRDKLFYDNLENSSYLGNSNFQNINESLLKSCFSSNSNLNESLIKSNSLNVIINDDEYMINEGICFYYQKVDNYYEQDIEDIIYNKDLIIFNSKYKKCLVPITNIFGFDDFVTYWSIGLNDYLSDNIIDLVYIDYTEHYEYNMCVAVLSNAKKVYCKNNDIIKINGFTNVFDIDTFLEEENLCININFIDLESIKNISDLIMKNTVKLILNIKSNIELGFIFNIYDYLMNICEFNELILIDNNPKLYEYEDYIFNSYFEKLTKEQLLELVNTDIIICFNK